MFPTTQESFNMAIRSEILIFSLKLLEVIVYISYFPKWDMLLAGLCGNACQWPAQGPTGSRLLWPHPGTNSWPLLLSSDPRLPAWTPVLGKSSLQTMADRGDTQGPQLGENEAQEGGCALVTDQSEQELHLRSFLGKSEICLR